MVKNRLKEIRMREYAEEPKEFSKRLEVNVKTYYVWENGAAMPSSIKMLEVAKKLNKKVEDIWWLE
ncbi:helix-turn-helix transcriptional regulator [Clostridium beijerinckii]|uniref:Helix-turn-helix domain-containing protein n=1 Tax=Clostridium beijerinckii TaxID=1520 RepID=A0A7X9XQV8_CLOBE|nr:helix-turn-helix domain-containing protein [Clostridium beijerinckii]NMF06575.1 helix-turn-helix domain-containing protein [Clostridium beijerinckii]